MRTIWVLAPTLFAATRAVDKNLGEAALFDQSLDFKFLATADIINTTPGEEFIVTKEWQKHPEAEEIKRRIPIFKWKQVRLKEIAPLK